MLRMLRIPCPLTVAEAQDGVLLFVAIGLVKLTLKLRAVEESCNTASLVPSQILITAEMPDCPLTYGEPSPWIRFGVVPSTYVEPMVQVSGVSRLQFPWLAAPNATAEYPTVISIRIVFRMVFVSYRKICLQLTVATSWAQLE